MIELERYQYQQTIANLQKQVELHVQLRAILDNDVSRRDAVIKAQQDLIQHMRETLDNVPAHVLVFPAPYSARFW